MGCYWKAELDYADVLSALSEWFCCSGPYRKFHNADTDALLMWYRFDCDSSTFEVAQFQL